MFFTIEESKGWNRKGYFYIMLHNKYNQKYNHRDIKRELDIPPHIYFDILNRNSGEFIGGHGFDCYYFKIKENAQIAIDEIESYLIIEKLMRE